MRKLTLILVAAAASVLAGASPATASPTIHGSSPAIHGSSPAVQLTAAPVSPLLVTGPVASVGPHSVKDVFATCAPGRVVVGGGYIQPYNTTQNGVVLVNGFAPDDHNWFVRVKNDSAKSLRIQAQATCQNSGSVRQVTGPSVFVAPHAVSDVFAGCAAGETVMGGGYIQPYNTTQDGVVLVDGFDPNANRWFVRVKNNSPAPLQIQAQVACDTPASTRQINGPVSAVAAHSVKDVFAICPAGLTRVGGGFIEPGNTSQTAVVLVDGFGSDNGWFVRVKNDSTASVQAQAQIRCR